MRRVTTLGIPVALAAAIFSASALPAFGGDTGTINATVTASSPCITIGTSSVSFGQRPFTTTTQVSSANTGEGGSSYTNCSGSSEKVFFHGTDAAGLSGTVWTLAPSGTGGADTCYFGTNVYKLSIRPEGGSGSYVVLKTNQELETAAASATRKLDLGVHMPCSGSSGAGETMSFQYILTAAF